ncbi:MAG TPA: EAL domain-containing protein [Pseudolabrys sp.]|nr:EAL domain-containing protein [Pseudolabrys sp.]
MRALMRKNLIAVAIGVLAAAGSLLAFDYWLDRLIARQSQEEINTSARRAISLAEARVLDAVGAIDELIKHGVDGCAPAQIDLMRRAVFETTPIKEVSVIAADGQVLCTNLGTAVGGRKILSSEPLGGAGGYTLDVLALGNGDRAVRLRRKAGPNGNSAAAIVPAILFLPQVSTKGGPFNAYAAMTTRSGALIGEAGHRKAVGAASGLLARQHSDEFGFKVAIAMPRSAIAANGEDLKWLGTFVWALMVTILFSFSLLMRRRQPSNPIAEIERALAAGEFVPFYQPVLDIHSGKLRGAEVLVRWRKPNGTLVSPAAFIPLAESSGLILEMTRDLMRRVCAEAGEAIGRRPELKISFNFAARLFRDKSIVHDLHEIFSSSPMPLSQVVLELTEREPIENFTETRQVIAALQGIGVRIAIDDVGTGHSGLSYMLKLGVDVIKIDKMFIDAIGTDRNSAAIVETLVDLAHNMRMDVVAEGVETFEQVKHLRELGIRLAQGYVFAPPLPGSSFLQLVNALDPRPAALSDQKTLDARLGYLSARNRFSAA